MKSLCAVLLVVVVLPLVASAQSMEFSGGYTHISGDGGLDGFRIGTAAWFTQRVSLAFDYDTAWDTSHLGVFELTQTGLVVSKSHLQDYLVGPRISFPGVLKQKQTHMPRLWPFGEVQIGFSHLSSSLVNPSTSNSQSGSDNAFSWMLGGGADYRLSPHWVGRFKVDLLRTHFSDTGQTRVRLSLGVAYTFGERGAKEAAEAKRKADEELAAAETQKKEMEETKCQVCRNRGLEEKAEAKRKEDAQLAESARTKSAEQFNREKQDLRARLLDHFRRVLPTSDTPRGLVVAMDDVLFDRDKAELRPEAREDLARLSGIVLNYPSLHLAIEGHTDNTGTAQVNQSLSEQRANAVRDYLLSQGLDSATLSAGGLGMNSPIADNGTPEGRQKNRRVEIIVSGEVIGTQVGY